MAGNRSNFNDFDVLRCFFLTNDKIGRADLAKKLELGEGTVKNILEILKKKKLIVSTNKGHVLSKKGEKALDDIHKIITLPQRFVSKNIYPDYKKAEIVVKKYSKDKKSYFLRDAAVKEGAEGAMIFDYDNTLKLKDYKKDFPDLSKKGIFVIGFANDYRTAENSVLAIASEMNKNLRKSL